MSYSSGSYLDSISEEPSNSQQKFNVSKDAIHGSNYGSLSYSESLERQFGNDQKCTDAGDHLIDMNPINERQKSKRIDQNHRESNNLGIKEVFNENTSNKKFETKKVYINVPEIIVKRPSSDMSDDFTEIFEGALHSNKNTSEIDIESSSDSYATTRNMLQELDVQMLDQQQSQQIDQKTSRNKVSGRIRTMHLINEYMTEHESIFHVFPSTDAPTSMLLFGVPKIGLDTKAMLRKISNKKKPTIFQHMAAFHNRFGFRHFMLIGLLALYAIAGGVMFQAVEADNEMDNLEMNRKMLLKTINRLSNEIVEYLNITNTLEIQENIVHLIRTNYVEMLRIEGKYVGSVFHKYEKIAISLCWYFGNAVFYAMTLFTTIGYGTIACQTTLGKILSIFYAMLGIPLMLVVLSDVGQIMLKWLTLAYEWSRRKYRDFIQKFHELRQNYRNGSDNKCNNLEKGSSLTESTSADDDEVTEFPLYLSIIIVLMYLLFVSFIVCFFDQHDGSMPGLSFGDAFYFSFISLTTVGLGDVMPNNIEYSPVLALLFLIGLALLSVVNSTVYMRVESKFLSIVDHLEAYLEKVHYYRHGNEGYFVFKMLEPNIQLLALTLPIFSDQDDAKSTDRNNPGPNRRNFPSPKLMSQINISRTRNRSFVETFVPTLGIVHPISRNSTFNEHSGNEGYRKPRAQTISGNNDYKKRARTISVTAFSNPDAQQPYYDLNFLSLSPKLSRRLALAARRKGKSEFHYDESPSPIEHKPKRIYLRRANKITPSSSEIKRVYSDRISSAIVEEVCTQEDRNTGKNQRQRIISD